MLSYSPYDNVRKQPYPNLLAVAGLHDPRVGYWEPAKWVQKLRENAISDSDFLLKMDMEVGHFSASDRYKYIREKSFEQAWALDKLGLLDADAVLDEAELQEVQGKHVEDLEAASKAT